MSYSETIQKLGSIYFWNTKIYVLHITCVSIKNKSQPIFLFFLDKFCPNGLERREGENFL